MLAGVVGVFVFWEPETMTVERKFIDLKELKVSDAGAGSIEGYRAVFSEIDEGGDLIVKGFFADSIPEYLRSGFTAHSHDWDFDKAVGFPVKAEEDDHGFLVESQFHSTPDAQVVRTKAVERMNAGKQVGFSFGYTIQDKSYIEAKDYKEQIPLFVKPERLQANLLKAQKFDRIRILKKGEVMEDSIVTAPMNRLAAATGVKSENKSMLAEEMAATTPSSWEVQSAFSRVIRKIAESAKNSDITDLQFDWKSKATLACSELGSEMTPLVISQIQEFLDSSDDEFYLKSDEGPRVRLTFEDHSQSVLAAVSELSHRAKQINEIRTKEGRTLSAVNRSRLSNLLASLKTAADDIETFLAETEPAPKEKGWDSLSIESAQLHMRAKAALALEL